MANPQRVTGARAVEAARMKIAGKSNVAIAKVFDVAETSIRRLWDTDEGKAAILEAVIPGSVDRNVDPPVEPPPHGEPLLNPWPKDDGTPPIEYVRRTLRVVSIRLQAAWTNSDDDRVMQFSGRISDLAKTIHGMEQDLAKEMETDDDLAIIDSMVGEGLDHAIAN